MIFVIVCLVIALNCEVLSRESFHYEKLHNFGQGRRIIPNYRRLNKYDFPEQFFTKKKPAIYIRPPYHSIYQGTWRKGDRRVYNKRFSHKAVSSAFRMISQATVDCIITHMSVETSANTPIIYRGGAGYTFFMVIVKSEPGVDISGRVRAYCKNVTQEH